MKIRKIVSMVLSFAICFSLCANFSMVKATDVNSEKLTFTLSGDGTYYLVGAKDTSIKGEIVVPGTYDGLPVRQVNSYGFKDCKDITKITLPEGIERLGKESFMDSGLTEIFLPSTLKFIANHTFNGCTELKNIDIPTSVTHIGDSVFSFSGIEKLIIPDSVIYRDIRNVGGKTPFDAQWLAGSCPSLKEVVLPSNMTSIGDDAFGWCESLEKITIPATVTKIGSGVFNNCSSLKEIYIPDSVATIDKDAFFSVELAVISLPANVRFTDSAITYHDWSYKMDHILFRGTEEQFNTMITEMEIEIDQHFNYNTVHFNCTAEAPTFTYTTRAAANCLQKSKIYYSCSECGENVCTMGGAYGEHILGDDGNCVMCAFPKTDTNQYFTFSEVLNEDGSEVIGYNVTDCDTSVTGALLVPGEYKGLPVKGITNGALAGCKDVKSIIIGEGVETIGKRAFWHCDSLEALTIPGSLLSIDDDPFWGTENKFADVYISDLQFWCEIDFSDIGVANPLGEGENLYLNGILVEDLVLPWYVTEVRDTAFYDCESIKSVTFSDKTEHIGKYAFNGCPNLTEVNIPDVPVQIDIHAFENTPIYDDANNWENGAFYIDNHLINFLGEADEFVVRDGTVDIAKRAFARTNYSGDKIIKKLVLPDSLVKICDEAFQDSAYLEEITFGTGLKSIGEYAFENCSLITALEFKSLEEVGDYAFRGVDNVKTLHIPYNLVELNYLACLFPDTLEKTTCDPNNPRFKMCEDGGLYTKDDKELVFFGNSYTTSYTLPEKTTVIADMAFCCARALSDITLHDNVEKIGFEAFAGTDYFYKNLSKADLYVGKYLVSTSSQNLQVKSGTLGIADGVVDYSLLKTIKLPESLEFIDGSFVNITSIDVASMDMWLNLTFNNPDGMQGLKDIYISVNGSIPTEIEIPRDMTTLNSYILGNCSNLQTVTIPETVTTIEDDTFYNYTPGRLMIYCLNGSVAHDYAIGKGILYKTFDIVSKDVARIDHVNKRIYTDVYNLSDIYNLITVTDQKTHFALGSQYSNGKHIWGTGSTITIYEGENRTDYTLIINGDINGDSVIDVLDVSYIEKTMNNNFELDNHSAAAADVNGDSQITVTDYQQALNTVLA